MTANDTGWSWITTIVIAIVLNIISAYLKPATDRLLSRIWHAHKHRSQLAVDEMKKDARRWTTDPQFRIEQGLRLTRLWIQLMTIIVLMGIINIWDGVIWLALNQKYGNSYPTGHFNQIQFLYNEGSQYIVRIIMSDIMTILCVIVFLSTMRELYRFFLLTYRTQNYSHRKETSIDR